MLKDVQWGIVLNLVDDFRRRVQKDKDQQHDRIGDQNPVGIVLRHHVERHEREPENKPDADDIPKILAETVEHVLDGQRPSIENRLLNQAQGCTD